MNIIIKSTKIIDVTSKYHNKIKDIYIEDGIIKKIGDKISKKGVQEYSSKNLHMSVGWMDMHCSFREPGYEYKDDLNSGIQSATNGGFTSVLLMPQTNPVIDNKSLVEFIKNNTKQSIIDVYTSGSVTKSIEGNDLVEMRDMNSAGCRVFTDDKKSLNRNDVMKL